MGGQAFRLACTRVPSEVPHSHRVAAVLRDFGVAPAVSPAARRSVDVRVGPARILALAGPSGSGKTTLLAGLARRLPAPQFVDRVHCPRDRALVDAVAPRAPLSEALHLLSLCALGEAGLWLRRWGELSDGEQFRARLARAVGGMTCGAAGSALLIDDFGAGLHLRAARAVAYNLRRLASRRELCFAVATCRHEVLDDLQADTTVVLGADGRATTLQHAPCERPIGVWAELHIERGRKRDYAAFAGMHYRATRELGFVDKIYVLRDRDGEVVGIVVYAHAPAGLALRNAATGGRFKGNLTRLNREMRILRRIVVHPDLRGCGIAHRFVRHTLPLVGTRYVECLATMGAINPVFERAGMRRIGVCDIPAHRRTVLTHLSAMNADPFAADFEAQVCRRPRVRALVARVVTRWYEATTGGGRRRVPRQSPLALARLFRGLVGTRPVYYLWEDRTLATGPTRCDETSGPTAYSADRTQ